jgi:hypothetical protein
MNDITDNGLLYISAVFCHESPGNVKIQGSFKYW